MAAQVEVQTGEVGRTVAGGRLHLSPLTDSSNKSLIEITSISESHVIVSEADKPAQSPKPRLTPKPFALEKATIKPILAPKPQTKPRPESTRLAGCKPDLPVLPKPTQRPVLTNPDRPASTTFRTSNKLIAGQTIKPVVQPFKPAPPIDLAEPSKPTRPMPAERRKSAASSLSYSKSLKTLSPTEWSGTTKEHESKQNGQNTVEPSITRAKSMGSLLEVEKEEQENNDKVQPDVSVIMRPQPRSSKSRPVSAIFPGTPTKTETPDPVPRRAGRRPLSADLTSKFESIGLSLHRKSPKENTKENTPMEKAPPSKKEQDKSPNGSTSESTESAASPVLPDQNDKKTEETAVKDAGMKLRISHFLESSSSPGAGGAGQDLHSPVQPVSEPTEPSVGVKQLIKQLTEDATPVQSPVLKPVLKPRPLPLDLTKRFSSERSPDLVSVSEAADYAGISKDPQRGTDESAVTPNDHKVFVDLKDSPEQLMKFSTSEGFEAGQLWAASKESGAGGEVHTVRASLFENVVEKQRVLMMDQGKSANTAMDSCTKEEVENQGTLITATYKEPISPSSPLRVSHAFDTMQAVEQNRAVSESIPVAQWEDKATTLRSRRSEANRLVVERNEPAQTQPASALRPESQPRYLRIGALQKWADAYLDEDAGLDKGTLNQSEWEGQWTLDKERDRQRAAYQDEVSGSSKPSKILQGEEQAKPRATYFALTGQMQELPSPGDGGTKSVDMSALFDDFSVRSALSGSQGKAFPARWNPSQEETFGKTSQSHEMFDELMLRSHTSSMDIRSQINEQRREEKIDADKKREQKNEAERYRAKVKEIEKEALKQMEIEKQRIKEWEMQRELERQRQEALEKERKEFEEKERALERQKQTELENQKLQELEKKKQRDIEKEKQRQLQKEKQELEMKMEVERDKKREKEKQKQREEERQREMEKTKHLMQEMERMKEMERQQMLEFQKLKQKEKEMQQLVELEKQKQREKAEKEAEKLRLMALEEELLKMKELEEERAKEMEMERQKEMERERQRELDKQRQREHEKERQRQMEEEKQRQLDKEKQMMEMERVKALEKQQVLEFQKQKEKEMQQLIELEKQRQKEKAEKEAEKLRQISLEQEMLRIKELEKERARQKEMEWKKQKELERQRQQDLEREKQRQLDVERQQLENERLRREQEKERRRKEELESLKEIEKRQLIEFEMQKESEREKQNLELEKRRQMEKMEKEEAERMRQIAKQQEAERQRIKEKQKKEEQERLRLESLDLRPKVLDLDSVLRNDLLSKPSSPRSDPATRWREPYKPAILDIDSFTPPAHPSPSKELLAVSGIQGLDAETRLQLTPERDVNWKVPSQTSVGFSSPLWTASPQDPWELRPVETPAVKPLETKKTTNKLSPEELLTKQEERLPNPQRTWTAFFNESAFSAPSPGTDPKSVNTSREVSGSTPGEQVWIPRELQSPQKSRVETPNHRRSHGSQEFNRMRSRSMSRRSAPSNSAAEASLSKVRSRSAHREQEHPSWVQQNQGSEEKEKDSGTPVRDTDSQYGTWETGLRSDDSLTPATPSSENNLSPSPRKPTPLHSPGDTTSQLDADTLDGVPPLSSSDSQPLPFPDAPPALLDNSVLRSRAQLGKKRAPRTRPSKAARQNVAQSQQDIGTSEDWLYKDSTEAKAESKDDDSESEETTRGADGGPAVASQPQRVALFPGVDPSALKAQLKKRSDSDHLTDGPGPSPSVSRSPNPSFLPRAARVLPPAGTKENSEEDSPQWLKELKSKKRLSQYESET